MMNDTSSRSHAIFTIVFTQVNYQNSNVALGNLNIRGNRKIDVSVLVVQRNTNSTVSIENVFIGQIQSGCP